MDSITVAVARRLIPFDLKEDQKNELIASMSLELNGPEPISKTTFLKLQKLAEDLDLSVAMGQECTDGFDQNARQTPSFRAGKDSAIGVSR